MEMNVCDYDINVHNSISIISWGWAWWPGKGLRVGMGLYMLSVGMTDPGHGAGYGTGHGTEDGNGHELGLDWE